MTRLFYDFYDTDEYEAFIKACMKTFRTSAEYKIWLTTTNNRVCALSNREANSIDIEVHHYGRTLFDLVSEIVDYFLQEDLKMNSFIVCLVLTELHLSGCIDYIPIDIGIHRAIHKDPQLIKTLYPDIEDKVVRGNKELKVKILEKWAKILAQIT